MKSDKNKRRKNDLKQKKFNTLQKITNLVEGFVLDLLDLIGLYKLVDWYIEHQEGMRYLIFGGLSTVINIIVFVLLEKIGFSTLISNLLAWIISIIFAYFTNKMCVFNSKTKNKKELLQEITSFVSCRILTLIIDEAYMYITIDIMHFNSLLMKVISNIIVIVLNFIFSKIFIFKNNNK